MDDSLIMCDEETVTVPTNSNEKSSLENTKFYLHFY